MSKASVGRMGRRSRPRAIRFGALIAGLGGLILAVSAGGMLGLGALVPPGPLSGAFWDQFLPLILIGGLVLVSAAWTWRRGRRRTSLLALVGPFALAAVVLGMAAYGRCAEGITWPSYGVWLLNLFTGQYESQIIGPDAVTAACRQFSPGFQTARLLGLSSVFMSAVYVLLATFGAQLDQLWVRFGQDLDVVIGVNEHSVALVGALARERARWRGAARTRGSDRDEWTEAATSSDDWFRSRKDRRRQALEWLLPKGVAVVHANGDDPLLGEMRAAGARVFVGDPHSREVLESIITDRRGRVTVRRLFAVTDSQQVNVQVLGTCQSIIKKSLGSAKLGPNGFSQAYFASESRAKDRDWLSSEWVPMLIAKLDDPRAARDWRVKHVNTPGCFLDAITVDDLLARSLIGGIAGWRSVGGRGGAESPGARICSLLVLIGDAPLGTVILDELAQRRAFVDELGKAGSAAQDAGEPGPEKVLLVSGDAERAIVEWERHRAPHARTGGLSVEVAPSGWENQLPVGTTGFATVVYLGPPTPELTARATRFSRLHPNVVVCCPSSAQAGLASSQPELPNTSLWLYGETFLERGQPPSDSWSVLARQNHEVYTAGRHGSGLMTQRRWEELPRPVQDDNLRLLRHLLHHQGEWAWVLNGQATTLSDDRVGQLAKAEHGRWCRLRLSHGWQLPPEPVPSQPTLAIKKDWERKGYNVNLVRWEDGTPFSVRESSSQEIPDDQASDTLRGIRTHNINSIRTVLTRLADWGIVPAVRNQDGA